MMFTADIPDGDQLDGIARILHELGPSGSTITVLVIIFVLTALYVWRMKVKDAYTNEALDEKDRTIRRLSLENKKQRDTILTLTGGLEQDQLLKQALPGFKTDEPSPMAEEATATNRGRKGKKKR